ncbi:hypothetical protein [Alteromonas sp. CYL-A6]|uniref:hypothetical protein n=1 Tax=Alteromonas nitratireducens TaxID=3390813 RepID=UPI0034BD0395
MTKPENDLGALWQSQPVATLDLNEIKRAYRRQTRQQRLYLAIDLLSALPAIILVWLGWDEFSPLAAGLLVGLGVVLLPCLGYLVWLRRIAAFSRSEHTRDHLNQLVRQMKNNVRIAWLTRHSAWVTPVFIAVFYVLLYANGEIAAQKVSSVMTSFVVICLSMAGFYVWAGRREKRFSRRYEELKRLAEQVHDDGHSSAD